MMNMSEFFTWSILASFAGAVTATAIVTQFVKEILKKIPTQIVSFIIALVLLFVATAATSETLIWQDLAIIPFNAVLVSIASNGAFAAIKRVNKS